MTRQNKLTFALCASQVLCLEEILIRQESC